MDSSCKPVEKYTEGVVENGKALEPSGEQEASEGCRSSPAWCKALPPEYRNELRELFKLAGPVVSARPAVKDLQFLTNLGIRRLCEGHSAFRLSRRR